MDLKRQGQRAFTGLHTRLYRRSGGRIGGRIGSIEAVLLTTTGRRSGIARTTPLSVVIDGERIVLIASNGGAAKHPDWYLNLLDNPDVVVQRQGEVLQLRARTARPEEREGLWRKAVGAYHGYAGYQRRTEREIPVVICEPTPPTTPQQGES